MTALQIRYVGTINVMSFRTAVLAHNVTGFVLIANKPVGSVTRVPPASRPSLHVLTNVLFRPSI